MRCDRCEHWTTRRETRYENGEVVANWEAPDGQGECDKLGHNTDADFGCVKFLETEKTHVVVAFKGGEPWQHWTVVPCPDCSGAGSTYRACHRCAGTGRVRRYDDGYVGEEQTRLHPKEKELLARAKPKCSACAKDVDRAWVACPYCGTRLAEPPAKTEIVTGALTQQGTTDEMVTKMREKRARDLTVVGAGSA